MLVDFTLMTGRRKSLLAKGDGMCARQLGERQISFDFHPRPLGVSVKTGQALVLLVPGGLGTSNWLGMMKDKRLR
jgi:hypothetical protein